MDEGLYLFAFLDFQKHGKRPENDLLRTLTQTEIKEAQFELNLTRKTIKKKWVRIYDTEEDSFIEMDWDKIWNKIELFEN